MPAKASTAKTGHQLGSIGMVAASADKDAFSIGMGGLVAPLANTKAAQHFLANIPSDTGQAQPQSDWLTAAKAQAQPSQQTVKRKTRWDS